jgi:hypothetical protein
VEGVIKSGVIGVSTSGAVAGSDLIRVGDPNPHGVFLGIHGEPGQSGTLLYSSAKVEPLPIGVYFGVQGPPSEFRPRGVCVPIPPLNSEELKEFKPIPPDGKKISARYRGDEKIEEPHASVGYTLNSDGKHWRLQVTIESRPAKGWFPFPTPFMKKSLSPKKNVRSHHGVLVRDVTTFVGWTKSGAAAWA